MNVLGPIDDALVNANGDAAAQEALAARLAAVLKTDATRRGKDIACRKLSLIGSAGSVSALAGLLESAELSHMARYALERMPCPQSVAAIREALPKVKGRLKAGMINSLGVRRDAQSTDALAALLSDSDPEVAAAAVSALGDIGTPEAASALAAFLAKAPEGLRLAAADAGLTCAGRLLADGRKPQARTMYKALAAAGQPKHIRRAAKRALKAAGKK